MGCALECAARAQLLRPPWAKEFGLTSLRSREPWEDLEERSDMIGPVPKEIHQGEV